MKKKILSVLMALSLLMVVGLTGCSWGNEADVVSRNISTEADNFNIYRKVTVINNQSDATMLEFEDKRYPQLPVYR